MEIKLQDDLSGLIHDLHEQEYAVTPSNQGVPLNISKDNELYAQLFINHPPYLLTERDEIYEIVKKYAQDTPARSF